MRYPEIDPAILSFGPLALRWYGLTWLAAFFVCWQLGNRQIRRHPDWSRQQVSDLVFYGALGAVLGGRAGYVLFYGFESFLRDPLVLLRIWDGGMSFHGGLLGVIAAMAWFGRRTGRRFWQVSDFVAPLVPLSLGLVRLGNFANTELPGRATDAPWGLAYPCQADAIRALNPLCVGDWEPFARHPSPLYQAFAEGVALFALLWWLAARPRPVSLISGAFLAGYGALRFVTEWFRAPDPHIGYVAEWFTLGQLLSLPMLALGAYIILRSMRPSAPNLPPKRR